jgi:hypothetical protein
MSPRQPKHRRATIRQVVRPGERVDLRLAPDERRTITVRDAFGTIVIAFDASWHGQFVLTTETCPNPRAHVGVRIAEAVARLAAWIDRPPERGWPENMEDPE